MQHNVDYAALEALAEKFPWEADGDFVFVEAPVQLVWSVDRRRIDAENHFGKAFAADGNLVRIRAQMYLSIPPKEHDVFANIALTVGDFLYFAHKPEIVQGIASLLRRISWNNVQILDTDSDGITNLILVGGED